MEKKLTYIVKKEDIGKTSMMPVNTTCTCGECSKQTFPFTPLGKVIPQDVGKKLVLIGEHWYAENQDQFFRRLMRKAEEFDICCMNCSSKNFSPVIEQPWKMGCHDCHVHFTPDYQILEIPID